MLQMEAEQGISCVVATPHIYGNRDNLNRFLERRIRAEEKLRTALKDHPECPELVVGAEVHYFSGIGESEAISNLGIGASKYILIEMSHSPWTKTMYSELGKIYDKQGMIPIIAHIDRYISRFRARGILQKLAQLPVLLQANAEFFLDKRTASMAMRMLEAGKIHLLGSDCHNLTDRKPNLADAMVQIKKQIGADPIEGIARLGRSVLTGEELVLPTQLCDN